MGAITPLGIGVDAFWRGALAGESGIAPIRGFDVEGFSCTIGGEIPEFDPRDFIDRKSARRMARFAQLAVAAAREAVEDAGLDLDSLDRERIGVVLGNGSGAYPDLEAGAKTTFERGAMRLDPLLIPRALPNMAAANIAMQFGLLGHNNTVITACAAGTHAIGEAAEAIAAARAAAGPDDLICVLGSLSLAAEARAAVLDAAGIGRAAEPASAAGDDQRGRPRW